MMIMVTHTRTVNFSHISTPLRTIYMICKTISQGSRKWQMFTVLCKISDEWRWAYGWWKLALLVPCLPRYQRESFSMGWGRREHQHQAHDDVPYLQYFENPLGVLYVPLPWIRIFVISITIVLVCTLLYVGVWCLFGILYYIDTILEAFDALSHFISMTESNILQDWNRSIFICDRFEEFKVINKGLKSQNYWRSHKYLLYRTNSLVGGEQVYFDMQNTQIHIASALCWSTN